MKNLSIGEFYSGPGGLGMGAKLARIKDKQGMYFSFDHEFATDYDPDSCETFRRNIAGNKEVICADIKDVDIENLPYVDGFLYGFPCNDFGSQESGTLEEIESFCSKNYGVTFQLMEKVKIKTSPVYKWLMNKSQNGVRNAKVLWNFHKFLVDENGLWSGSFLPTTSPNSSSIKDFALGA